MNSQIEIHKEYHSQLIKYKYYIIALCVTSIGYSIFRTTGKNLECLDILLAIAVSAWGISIYLGFRFLKCSLSILHANNALFEIHKGIHPYTGTHPEKIEIGDNSVKEIIKELGKIGLNVSVWQERLFYLGIVLFIIWHILKMY